MGKSQVRELNMMLEGGAKASSSRKTAQTLFKKGVTKEQVQTMYQNILDKAKVGDQSTEIKRRMLNKFGVQLSPSFDFEENTLQIVNELARLERQKKEEKNAELRVKAKAQANRIVNAKKVKAAAVAKQVSDDDVDSEQQKQKQKADLEKAKTIQPWKAAAEEQNYAPNPSQISRLLGGPGRDISGDVGRMQQFQQGNKAAAEAAADVALAKQKKQEEDYDNWKAPPRAKTRQEQSAAEFTAEKGQAYVDDLLAAQNEDDALARGEDSGDEGVQDPPAPPPAIERSVDPEGNAVMHAHADEAGGPGDSGADSVGENNLESQQDEMQDGDAVMGELEGIARDFADMSPTEQAEVALKLSKSDVIKQAVKQKLLSWNDLLKVPTNEEDQRRLAVAPEINAAAINAALTKLGQRNSALDRTYQRQYAKFAADQTRPHSVKIGKAAHLWIGPRYAPS